MAQLIMLFLIQTIIANYLDYKTTQIDNLISKKERLVELLHECYNAGAEAFLLGLWVNDLRNYTSCRNNWSVFT
ncbi:hypothetical protein N9164_15990 [Draconibacterium sp.]|nr:hypothetical protein [Draconibacterium sp.]